jgi:hypothetical protein
LLAIAMTYSTCSRSRKWNTWELAKPPGQLLLAVRGIVGQVEGVERRSVGVIMPSSTRPGRGDLPTSNRMGLPWPPVDLARDIVAG